jgi:hypothetical protein
MQLMEEENSSGARGKRTIGALFTIVTLLALTAVGDGDFIPAPSMVWAGLAGALCCGLAVATLVVLAMLRQVREQKYLIPFMIFVALSMALVGAGFSLKPLILGLPTLYNTMEGVPAARTVTVTGWLRGRRTGCYGPLIAEIPSYLGKLCFYPLFKVGMFKNLQELKTEFGYYPPVTAGTVLTLQGLETKLGFYVTHIDPPKAQ